MSHDIAIRVDRVSKTFRLPHEKVSSIKSAVINFYKRSRTYEVQKALDDVSFEIKKGEFFGIVGRNGSGKSTLLKMLAGIYTPSQGFITVNGKLTPFIELGVGFNPELSGRENVYLNGALLGFSRAEMASMYGDIVSFAELQKFMDQKLKNYSSGMQVRLAFSIAIRAQGDILLLDEVLAVGDAAFQQKCYNYFEELRKQKKTVVFVSHDMSAVRRFCTDAVYIKDGQLIQEGSASEIADLYTAENIDKANQSDNKASNDHAKYEITARITRQTEAGLQFEAKYSTREKTKMYIGISVFKDGASIAEITTDPKKPLVGSGKATYFLDTTVLNSGLYQIGAALFAVGKRELLDVYRKENQFLIPGEDVRRGGAIKLADTWEFQQTDSRKSHD